MVLCMEWNMTRKAVTVKGVPFLRMANDRGWCLVNDVEGDGSVVFTRVKGALEQER